MSRTATLIPVDSDTRRVLVEDFASRLPRCDCCPGGCVSCEDETRTRRTFADTIRSFSPEGNLLSSNPPLGQWNPVSCEDPENPFGDYPLLINGIGRAGDVVTSPDALLFGGDCLLPPRLSPEAGLFPLTICRVYYWENPAQLDLTGPELGNPPVWIAAQELVTDENLVVGWWLVQQFRFTGAIFNSIAGFTPDVNWPFSTTPAILWGCDAGATIIDDILRIDLA